MPADQSIPASLAKQLARRDGTMPQVKALHLDTNFAATDPSKYNISSPSQENPLNSLPEQEQ